MPPNDPMSPQEVRLTAETINYLKEEIATAVAAGIKGAINEQTAKQFWVAGLEILQQQAQEKTGKFVIGGVWAGLRKLALFIALGLIVYSNGGWAALAKMWVAIKGA